MQTITVTLNGQAQHIKAASTLADVLATATAASTHEPLTSAPPAPLPTAFASAVNGEFVPKHERASRLLQEGDQILTFEAITGG